MASIVSVVVSDDLDGSPNAETVAFGFDGVNYEIDLAEKNRAKLAQDFAPYVGAARKVSQRRPRSTNAPQPASRVDRAAVRAWAKEQGLKISERGRIGAEIMQQYEAAH
jgi:Spy/CpxP family protein refolding chaperone